MAVAAGTEPEPSRRVSTEQRRACARSDRPEVSGSAGESSTGRGRGYSRRRDAKCSARDSSTGRRDRQSVGRGTEIDGWKRRATRASKPMSAGLFEIRLGRRDPAAPAPKLEFPARAESPFRPARERGLHRYCCGCARETEHVLCQEDGRGSIPAIRWPAVKSASGTTICVDCGQWRSAASRPSGIAWSSWPRTPATAGAALIEEGPLESAAENEGKPPLRGPRRLPRRQPARTMKKAIATY